MTVAVIVPRLTIDRQKVIPKWGSGFSPFKSQSRGQVGRKEHLLYFRCQYVVGGGWAPVQRLTALFLENEWARAFIDRGRGLRAETAESALTVILKFIIGV